MILNEDQARALKPWIEIILFKYPEEHWKENKIDRKHLETILKMIELKGII